MAETEKDLIEALRAAGYRITLQRRLICRVLAESPGEHLTAADIVARADAPEGALDPSTVYRTLEALHQAGMVDLMAVGSDRMLFALRDPNECHGHLICERCGRMLDIAEQDLQRLAKQIGQRYRFRVDIRHLTLRGHCSQCSAAAERGSGPG